MITGIKSLMAHRESQHFTGYERGAVNSTQQYNRKGSRALHANIGDY